MNNMRVHKIVGVYMNGVQIVGYQLIDTNGVQAKVTKEVVENAAGKGLINNCTLVEYEGKRYLKGIGMKLSELPTIDLRTGQVINKIEQTNDMKTMVITGRITNVTGTVGYVLRDKTGNEYKLSLEKVWQLAKCKNIVNASGQLHGNIKILRGIGMELHKLPEIRV